MAELLPLADTLTHRVDFMNQLVVPPASRFWQPRLIPLLCLLALCPVVFWGAETVPSNTADLIAWLPDSGAQRQGYAAFVEMFGEDNFLLVSWPGCQLDEPQLAEFTRQLTRQPRSKELIRRTITGRDMLDRLTAEPLKLSRRKAVDRLRGVLLGEDRRTTGALLLLSTEGKQAQTEVLQLARRAAEQAGVSADQLRLGGSVYEAVTIDEESHKSLQDFVLPVFLVTMLIAWLCLRRWSLVLLVVLVAAFSRYMSLAFLSFTGGQLDLVMIVLPVLLIVLTVSGAVHLLNYYLDACRERGPQGAGQRAFRAALVPCTLACGSTALGLISLCISQIAPIRGFGAYSAITLLIALVMLLLVVPMTLDTAAFAWFDRRTARGKPLTAGASDSQTEDAWVDWLVASVIRHRRLVVWGGFALMLSLGAGMAQIQTTVKIEKMFQRESRIIQDYQWMEEQIAPLVSVETLVHFQPDSPLRMVDRLSLVEKMQREFRATDEINGVSSAAIYCPKVPQASGVSGAINRGLINNKLESHREQLVEEGFLSTSEQGECWRITAKAPAIASDDYGQVMHKLQQISQRLVQELPPETAATIRLEQTGILPMIDFAHAQLLTDLVLSLALAVVMICPVMMISLRSFWGGVLAMFPNLFPIIVVFGALGWLGVTVDVGSVLTGSIALGIAVDDTLHVLNWYKLGVAAGMSTIDATRMAYRRCARAMFQTTVICGCGILVLAFSSFVPTSRFAILLTITLAIALIGDMLLLPALLTGSLGKALLPATRGDEDLDAASTNLAVEPT